MISTFMSQINSLQTELRQLAHAQNQTHDLVAQRERSIEKERKLKDDIKRKYKVLSIAVCMVSFPNVDGFYAHLSMKCSR